MTAKPNTTLDPKSPFYDDGDDFFDTPSKYAPPTKPRRYPEEVLEESRTRLFEEGSEFKPTVAEEVVGIDNVLQEIDRLIHWLAHSKEYQKYEARLEPGVIFEGEPGTGKTLVSRYIATASGALFVNVRDFEHNGSLFKDSDIADLFKRARETYAHTGRPVVLFWDEFENGACDRASASPEQAATVSQLTAELDGIHGKNEGILLIGCTNYIYGIDAALRRSGRMGLQIEFHAPDRIGKKLLLSHYIGKYKVSGEIDTETLSYFFGSDATAADIEESCMEAWRLAVYRTLDSKGVKEPCLTQLDLIDIFLKRLVGPPTAFINLPKEDRARIAVHEVGHAIMALVFDIPLRLITVQPGKKSLGRTITAEVKEHIGTTDEMISDMRVGIGSIVAESQAGLAASVGATGDVVGINKVAIRLVDNLYSGQQTRLFNVGTIASSRGGGGPGAPILVSQEAVNRADADARALMEQIEADARKVMASIGKNALWDISNRVNDEITMTGKQFREAFEELVGRPEAFRPY